MSRRKLSLFDITLPPQTGVNDYTKGAAPAYFIVENDGSKRAYSPFQPPDLKTKVATGLRRGQERRCVGHPVGDRASLVRRAQTADGWYSEHGAWRYSASCIS